MALQFHRVRATNWRNFSNIDVVLQNRAFLVGANASGKSNFLDIFRFLADIAASSGGGLQQAVNNRGGVSSIRHINAREVSYIALDISLSDDERKEWRYQLEFNQDSRGALLRYESVWRNGRQLLERPDTNDKMDKARLRQTHLEQTFANAEFREITQFFQSVRYAHIVPQLIRDIDRYMGQKNDPFGSDFLERISDIRKNSREARLRRIQNAVKIAIPQLSELVWIRDKKGIPHLQGRYEGWRARGMLQKETEFSDGTLRLIGLLWVLQDGEGPLLLEEPELSLHPGVVRYLPQMMLNVQRQKKKSLRQTIISTHSPDLLSDEGIGADEILLFRVTESSTEVQVGADDESIMQELAAGFTVADIVIPRTQPAGLHQLALW